MSSIRKRAFRFAAIAVTSMVLAGIGSIPTEAGIGWHRNSLAGKISQAPQRTTAFLPIDLGSDLGSVLVTLRGMLSFI